MAAFTVTVFGQRMRCSEIDLKSSDASGAASALGAAAAVTAATGALTAAGEGASAGLAGTIGGTRGGATTSSAGLAAGAPRLMTTLKFGAKNSTPPTPTRAPKRKRRSPRKNAAMREIRNRP